MSRLVTLPTELKDLIIHQTSPEDILKLSRTCRAMRNATLPALYHTLRVPWEAPHLETHYPIIPLMRTLLETPILAMYVRKIAFQESYLKHDWDHVESGPSVDVCDIRASSQALLKNAFDTANIPWKNDIRSIVTLFLTLCSNLQELNCYSHFLTGTTYGYTQQWPTLASLTALRIQRCDVPVPPQMLERVLKQTPNLKVLECHLLFNTIDTRPPLDCTMLRNALLHVQSSLTELVVRCAPAWLEETGNPSRVCTGSLSPLRDFSSLKSLNVSLAVLFGSEHGGHCVSSPADMLPSSLQRLTLYDDTRGDYDYDQFDVQGEHIMAVLKMFFSAETRLSDLGWKNTNPYLYVVLDLQVTGILLLGPLWPGEKNKEVEIICKAQGIKYEVVPGDYNKRLS